MDEEQLGFNRGTMVLLLLVCLMAWMAFNWFETVQRIVHCYTAAPVEDYWRVAGNLHSYRAFDLRVLWMQHNEHRIVFPEIVFALDMLLWRGRLILPLAVSFLCYLSIWIVLAQTLFTDRSLSFRARMAAVLLAGIIVGWKGSATVLATPFLLNWTLMQAGVVLSLALLSRAKHAATNVCLILAIAAAVVATYSSGNALLLWPLLLAAGWVLRLTKRRMTALGIAAAASIGLYFIGYNFSDNLNIKNLVLHPLYFLGFLGTYLSMPFGGLDFNDPWIMKSPQFGVCIGLIGLSIVVILFVIAVRARLVATQPGIVLFGCYAFTLLSAALTAAGRMDPTDSGFNAAKVTRYLTLPLVNWAIFVLLCLWLAFRFQWKIFHPAAIAFLVAVLVFVGFLKLRWWVEASNDEFAREQMAELSLEDGLSDPGLIRKIFPDPSYVYRCLPELRQGHLSAYHSNRAKWLGRPVGQFSKILSSGGSGEITFAFPVRSGIEVGGWADTYSRGTEFRWIVLGNENGRIVGFGERLPAGFPEELRSLRMPPSLAWVGFVNLKVKTKAISAYIVDPRRRGLFPIAESLAVPEVHAASLNDMGILVPKIEWQKDPAWTLNGFRASRFDPPPPDPIYGSLNGSGANNGRMVSSVFATPSKACLILPILHGDLVNGLSVDIRNADTGQSLETAPMQNRDTEWEFWRFQFDPAVKHLRIAARDQGRYWGDWMAIGPPAECE